MHLGTLLNDELCEISSSLFSGKVVVERVLSPARGQLEAVQRLQGVVSAFNASMSISAGSIDDLAGWRHFGHKKTLDPGVLGRNSRNLLGCE